MSGGPYLILGHKDGWKIIDAWVTEDLAVEALERLKLSVMSPHDRKNMASPKSPWRFWVKKSNNGHRGLSGANKMPVKWLHCWSANSVGGINGNPWLYLCVVELIVQGTVLDHLSSV